MCVRNINRFNNFKFILLLGLYRGADKSLARDTSWCILFDVGNISFDVSLVLYTYIYIYIYISTILVIIIITIYIILVLYIYIYSTNIHLIMIIKRIYEHKNLLSL